MTKAASISSIFLIQRLSCTSCLGRHHTLGTGAVLCMQVSVIYKQVTPPSLDEQGRYLVGAAVGTRQQDRTRVDELVKAGINVVILDSSQGNILLQQI